MAQKNIYAAMTAAALFWSGAFIAGKFSVPWIPTFTLTFLRFLFAAAALRLAGKTELFSDEGERNFCVKKEHWPVFLFNGIVGMFGYHVFFFLALKSTTAINASIIGAMNPIVTTIFAAVWMKTKIPGRQIFGIILSFAGVLLTLSGGSLEVLQACSFNRGDLLMAAAVLCWAAYGVFSKCRGKGIPPLSLTYYSFVVCTVILIPFVLWEKPWSFMGDIPASAWLAVLYMSLFPSVAGYLIQQIAIKIIGPSRTSVFINLVPIFSMILAVPVLGETLKPVKVLTAGIIIAGVWICQFSIGEKKEEHGI